LPDIFDPDSVRAYIKQILMFPQPNFVSFINTKQKTGSYFIISPTKESQVGSYLCVLWLVDDAITPRITPVSFNIEVLKP